MKDKYVYKKVVSWDNSYDIGPISFYTMAFLLFILMIFLSPIVSLLKFIQIFKSELKDLRRVYYVRDGFK